MSLSYEEGKKVVFRGLLLLAAITIVEVAFALLAKGHLIHGFNLMDGVGRYAYMAVMIGASVYKAYFIIFEFMHMKYEVKGLAMSVLMPICLLVWAIIAFFQEGGSWGARRALIKQKNEEKVTMPVAKPQGALDIKTLDRF
jgi:cytochrome c oxidase subunit IV